MSLCPRNPKPVTVKTTEIFFSQGTKRTVLYQPVYNTGRQTHEKETVILDKIWKRINNNRGEFCVEMELCQGNPVLVPLASRFLHHVRIQENTVRQMGMSPTATNPSGQKCKKSDSEGDQIFVCLFFLQNIFSEHVRYFPPLAKTS